MRLSRSGEDDGEGEDNERLDGVHAYSFGAGPTFCSQGGCTCVMVCSFERNMGACGWWQFCVNVDIRLRTYTNRGAPLGKMTFSRSRVWGRGDRRESAYTRSCHTTEPAK